jgi:polyisoprenoid-binding protein YceI
MTYQIDPQHSAAQFKVRHMMISNVKGEFDRIRGTVDFDPAHPEATKVDAVIDVASISTREPDRDTHLKSADFFDVQKFPEITFKSTGVAVHGDGHKVTGELTIHGVTKTVTLESESLSPEINDGWGNLRRGLSAHTHIDRRDFGLVFNMPMDGGGVVVGDKVDITLDLEMTRKPA